MKLFKPDIYYHPHFNEAAHGFNCNSCGAEKSKPCLTPSGKRSNYPHAERMNKWRQRTKERQNGRKQTD